MGEEFVISMRRRVVGRDCVVAVADEDEGKGDVGDQGSETVSRCLLPKSHASSL